MDFWYVYRIKGCIVVGDHLPETVARGAEQFMTKAQAERRAVVRRDRMFDVSPVHYFLAAAVVLLILFAAAIADVIVALF